MRNGSKIRAIGLQQQMVDADRAHCVSNRLSVFEGQDSADAEFEAELGSIGLCLRRIAGEAVHNAAHCWPPLFPKNRGKVRKRIPMVKDDGLGKFASEY